MGRGQILAILLVNIPSGVFTFTILTLLSGPGITSRILARGHFNGGVSSSFNSTKVSGVKLGISYSHFGRFWSQSTNVSKTLVGFVAFLPQ